MHAALARLAAPPADSDLLSRFAAARDGAAFAELVRRHGPAVLAVCRRLARHHHDAEDAFQATFLVLARKAARLRPGPLGGWLVGAAARAARKAAARRREVPTAAVPEVPARTAEPFDPDAAAAVLEEVGRLPPPLREAVVRCELGGRPRAAAARELGIPEGTLSSRLAAARKTLAERLTARGFAPAALAALAPAAVPPRLTAAATHSPAVESLSREVLRTMTVEKLQAVSWVVATATAGLVAAASVTVASTDAAPPPRPVPVAAEQPRPAVAAKKAVGPNRLVVWQRDNLIAVDPDGGNRKVVLSKDQVPWGVGDLQSISPDGKWAVILHPTAAGYGQYIYPLGRPRPAADEEELSTDAHVAWSADGTELAVCTDPTEPEVKATGFVLNPATKARTPIRWPTGYALCDWSPDGKTFLAIGLPNPKRAGVYHELWLIDRDGTPRRRVADNAVGGTFSPDGTRVLVPTIVYHNPNPTVRPDPLSEYEVNILDLATGRSAPVAGTPRNCYPLWCCWSPDGSRIAYLWKKKHPEGTPLRTPTATELVVCDPDGRNARTILADRYEQTNHYVVRNVFWR